MISPGLAGVTFTFTFKMKPRRILHEKTQGFLRGRWRTEAGAFIDKELRLTGGGESEGDNDERARVRLAGHNRIPSHGAGTPRKFCYISRSSIFEGKSSN